MAYPNAPVAGLELHLSANTDLPAKHGNQIRKLGGSYSACRGHQTTRFVNLPYTHDEADKDRNRAVANLANELISVYRCGPSTCVIFRGETLPEPFSSIRATGLQTVFYCKKVQETDAPFNEVEEDREEKSEKDDDPEKKAA